MFQSCLIIVFIIDFGVTWGCIESSAWVLQSLCLCVFVYVCVYTRVYIALCMFDSCKCTSASQCLCSWLTCPSVILCHSTSTPDWSTTVCGWYDVLHSRRAFSVCLACVYVHDGVLFWCAPRHTFCLSISEDYIHVLYTVHTYIWRHINHTICAFEQYINLVRMG